MRSSIDVVLYFGVLKAKSPSDVERVWITNEGFDDIKDDLHFATKLTDFNTVGSLTVGDIPFFRDGTFH